MYHRTFQMFQDYVPRISKLIRRTIALRLCCPEFTKFMNLADTVPVIRVSNVMRGWRCIWYKIISENHNGRCRCGNLDKTEAEERREGVCSSWGFWNHCGGHFFCVFVGSQDQCCRQRGRERKLEGGGWFAEQCWYHPTSGAAQRWFQGKEYKQIKSLTNFLSCWNPM